MRSIEIIISKDDLQLSEEEQLQTLSFSMSGFDSAKAQNKIFESSTLNDAGDFFYSLNTAPDTYFRFPRDGITYSQFDNIKFVIDPQVLRTPFFCTKDNIFMFSTFCDKVLSSEEATVTEIMSISSDLLSGDVYACCADGKVFKFWPKTIDLKESLQFPAGCIKILVDGLRQRLWLFYSDRIILSSTKGEIIATYTIPYEIYEMQAATTLRQSGKMFFAAKSDATVSGFLFGFIDRENDSKIFTDREVFDIAPTMNDYVLITSSSGKLYISDGSLFSLLYDLAPLVNLSISSNEDEQYIYVFDNSIKRLVAVDIATGLEEWHKDFSDEFTEDEFTRLSANWQVAERKRRPIYYYSNRRMGVVLDYERHGDKWKDNFLTNSTEVYGFTLPPAVDKLVFMLKLAKTTEFPDAGTSSSSSSSTSSVNSSSSTP